MANRPISARCSSTAACQCPDWEEQRSYRRIVAPKGVAAPRRLLLSLAYPLGMQKSPIAYADWSSGFNAPSQQGT
jgi:hypothetical protein